MFASNLTSLTEIDLVFEFLNEYVKSGQIKMNYYTSDSPNWGDRLYQFYPVTIDSPEQLGQPFNLVTVVIGRVCEVILETTDGGGEFFGELADEDRSLFVQVSEHLKVSGEL